MMPSQETVDAVNTAGEYGTYIPGRRMEVEQGPWDAEAVSGLGPGERIEEGSWYVVQRDDSSPHPITWHSRVYDSAEFARYQMLRRQIRHEKDRGEDWRHVVPMVSHLAFDKHHSHFRAGKCTPNTSVAGCETKACVQEAIRDIRDIIGQGDLINRLLGYGEYV